MPKHIKPLYGFWVALFLMASSMVWAQAEAPVHVWEAPLALPTYEIGPPEQSPMFFAGRIYQGAAGKIYPYPMYDRILDVRSDKTYPADFLENKYVKICVLPQLGGRVLSATDKTDGYDYVYRQTEIKPALVGMIGAWISGGMEWDIPSHHRSTSYLPVEHRLVKNADGSSTMWVGDVDLQTKMQWLVGLTLYPGKSYLKVTTKLLNGAPLVQSFLDFTNTATHVNKNYQVIFPPDTQFAVYHAKVQFTHWPISHEIFMGVDYRRGVNISWWKNNPAPISFFDWNFNSDFFGGYDHGVNAGTICVQNHYLSPGAKFWEWGNGPEGEMWDKLLDSQGPYLELMAGNFSDNQPDYSWIQPYETKVANQYWYPIRGIRGAKNANLNGAVNLEVEPSGKVFFGFSTTQAFDGAKVILTGKGQTLFEQTVDIDPKTPFVHEVALPAGMNQHDIKAALSDSHGNELVSYQPVKLAPEAMPPTVMPPPPPAQITSVDKLYHTGLRLEQFHNATRSPYPYYEEALRRDPENYEVNTALGRLYCERGLWRQAIERLKLALHRATYDYTRPKDGEADYDLGVALRAEGEYREAEDAFYRASWSEAWTAASYFQLAELEGKRGHWAKVVSDLDHSLDFNTPNAKAWDLKAVALRKLGRGPEAQEAARRALAVNPLDLWAANELSLSDASDQPRIGLGNALQSNLWLVLDYDHAGLDGEAEEVLKRLVAATPGQNKVNPLLYYYLGYFSRQRKQAGEASQYFRLARQMPSAYVFPFRLETVKVLEAAMKTDPENPLTPYYLGNALYYLEQPSAAIAMWKKSAAMDSSFAPAWRNLAFAYEHAEANTAEAVAAMEKAVDLDRGNAYYRYELDVLYEEGNGSPQKRLASLEADETGVAKRSDALMQEIKVNILLGRYDRAIQLLKNHEFHNWEGASEIHDVYMDAYLLRGEREFRAGKYQDALQDYEAAPLYPGNLEVGRPYRQLRLPQVDYWAGLAQEKLGNAAKSQQLFQQAMAPLAPDARPEMEYYQGLAALKLGQNSKAKELFGKLIATGQETLAGSSNATLFTAKFGGESSKRYQLANAHYLIGLGNLGNGETAKARREFEDALKVDINHLGATAQLSALVHTGALASR
jgi:tetratricopeptide (TPR) repeat protein